MTAAVGWAIDVKLLDLSNRSDLRIFVLGLTIDDLFSIVEFW